VLPESPSSGTIQMPTPVEALSPPIRPTGCNVRKSEVIRSLVCLLLIIYKLLGDIKEKVWAGKTTQALPLFPIYGQAAIFFSKFV
jgi:hypothetical protein